MSTSKYPAIIPVEDEEQQLFIAYLDSRPELKYTAIPNNTYSPHMSVKVKNKKMGLRAGFPDMVVVVPNIGLACVEMKRIKGGVASPEQKDWIEALNTCPGVEARICKGHMAAIAFIEELSPSKYGQALLFDKSIF